MGWPGRENDYDCNSQVPTGLHNNRIIYYVFGRYPSKNQGEQYPVLDLVICHGDFLNCDHYYIHKNKSLSGFGSYGDLKIRDRKMYIAPTPYGLVTGLEQEVTLILPKNYPQDSRLQVVGHLTRFETDRVISSYSFDLTNNQLIPHYRHNLSAGQSQNFIAYRVQYSQPNSVIMKV